MTTLTTHNPRSLCKRVRWWDEYEWTELFDDPSDDIDFHGHQQDALADGWHPDPYGSNAGDTFQTIGYVRYDGDDYQLMQLSWYESPYQFTSDQPMEQDDVCSGGTWTANGCE